MNPTPPKIHLRSPAPGSPQPGAADGTSPPRRRRPEGMPEPVLTTEYRQPRLRPGRRRGRGRPSARKAPRTAPRPRRRTGTLRRVIAVLLLVPVIALGAGLLYGWFQWNRIPREDSLGELPPPADVETILLVGSDTRADLEDGDGRFGGSAVEGQRADSIVLLVLPPGHEKATMLSIPRDLRVDIPGRGVGKINGAFNGGAPMMVAAVQAATGLTVNHYVEVNFDGFRELSSAVGGVEICVDTPVRDQYSLLDLEAGCHVLAGDMALAWVRARHLERFENGEWRSDPTGDFGRMQRQQEFLQKLMGKMGSPASVLRLPAITSAAQAAFEIDAGFSYWHALRLGLRFFPSPGAKLQFATLPSEPKSIGGVSYVVPIEPGAGQLLDQLRSGQVPAVGAPE